MAISSVAQHEDIAASLKEVMAAVCTPVSVVTAMDGERPHGTTVSAFTSLSMTPPMVLVSLDRSSALLGIIQRSGRFGVNILGSAQSAAATAFACKGADKFADTPWTRVSGVPRLDGAPGWVVCDASAFVEGGDHILILGDVREAVAHDGPPLTYFRRDFGTHMLLAQEHR
ncbi:flavin reductase [Rhodococcus oxybenzonivorans]|uniref:Flavin reductase n=1 Tax=Rhodococcus oxybenzonivorans TaxID=1990687 RepID=A0A2S2C0F2_9NOCA|nr:flavin reductase family protein [Rhodococcus oxybenzonivorans]AWK74342.1 flavin reductase [Rhodococcus oxybenzonivorans]